MAGRAQVPLVLVLLLLAPLALTPTAAAQSGQNSTLDQNTLDRIMTVCNFSVDSIGDIPNALVMLVFCPFIEGGRGIANLVSGLLTGILLLVLLPFLAIFAGWADAARQTGMEIITAIGAGSVETMAFAQAQLRLGLAALPGISKTQAPVIATFVLVAIVAVVFGGMYLSFRAFLNVGPDKLEEVTDDSEAD